MTIEMLESTAAEYRITQTLIERHHSHLREARLVLLKTEKNKTKGDLIIIATASKTSPSEKAIHGYDFKILIRQNIWDTLDDAKKMAVLDHELTHCSVQYVPMKEPNQRTGKLEIVKDEYGRKKYSTEIARDENGAPKWTLKPHDLEEFRSIIQKYGIYDEAIQAFSDVLSQNT